MAILRPRATLAQPLQAAHRLLPARVAVLTRARSTAAAAPPTTGAGAAGAASAGGGVPAHGWRAFHPVSGPVTTTTSRARAAHAGVPAAATAVTRAQRRSALSPSTPLQSPPPPSSSPPPPSSSSSSSPSGGTRRDVHGAPGSANAECVSTRFSTIIEPFRIHSVQALSLPSDAQREAALRKAGYNLFALKAEDVIIDLLTDSGTGAMSSRQWGAMLDADESYAGSKSFWRFHSVVQRITGFPEVIPTHQGRAAERILFSETVSRGQVVPNNIHFDTTRANVEYQGAEALDYVIPEGLDPASRHPFKGNVDVGRLDALLADKAGAGAVPMVMVTVTNNSGGGQPVSLANLHDVRALCDKHGVLLFLDACRFAENAFFIKTREEGQSGRSPAEIAREMFSLADGCTFSAKKDGLANIGGFLGLRDPELARRCRNLLILTEGFPTYGGLAGYDMEAIAVGLDEVLDEHYLQYRLRSTAYLADKVNAAGVPTVQPVGGHAVYLDARALLPHLPPSAYPAQALAVELYRTGGVRGVEIGSVMFGKADPGGGPDVAPAPMELVRLAIPRRTYTQSHVDYVAEVVIDVAARAGGIGGFRITEQAPWLRHFTARFEPL